MGGFQLEFTVDDTHAFATTLFSSSIEKSEIACVSIGCYELFKNVSAATHSASTPVFNVG